MRRRHYHVYTIVNQSPAQGKLRFGWRGPLRQEGRVIPLRDYPRYDNPYVQTEFPADRVAIRHNDQALHAAAEFFTLTVFDQDLTGQWGH